MYSRNNINTRYYVKPHLIFCAVLVNFYAHAMAEDVVVYSARAEQLLKPIIEVYKKETGVNIKLVSDKEGPLMERLRAEGRNSRADLLLTVDAGNLWQASRMGLFKPVKSPILDANIPSYLRDPENEWYGLSIRARTIFYNNQRVKASQLSNYADLSDPKWRGRLCLRTSKKVYNQSLVAMMLSDLGPAKTEKVVKGWVDNLATREFPDDTKMLEAIAAGQCEVGIANTYYYGRLMKKLPHLPVSIFWADQAGNGTHVNISGAGILKYAKNEKGGLKFLEWLSGSKAQHMFASVNMEFPVNPQVTPDQRLAAWGTFKHSYISVANAGSRQAEAVRLMDRVGYK